MKTKQVIAYYNNIENIALVLGINQSAVYKWGDDVPDGRAYQLHDLSNGDLKFNGVFTAKQRRYAKKVHEHTVEKNKLNKPKRT